MTKLREPRYSWCSDASQALHLLQRHRAAPVWHVVHDPRHPAPEAEEAAAGRHDVMESIRNAFQVQPRADIHRSVTHTDGGFRRSLDNALRGAFGGILVELRGETGDAAAARTVQTVLCGLDVAVVGATPRFREAVNAYSNTEQWKLEWKRVSVDMTLDAAVR